MKYKWFLLCIYFLCFFADTGGQSVLVKREPPDNDYEMGPAYGGSQYSSSNSLPDSPPLKEHITSATMLDSASAIKKRKGPAPRMEVELCLVCGDRASGFHYNALSCEGCKGEALQYGTPHQMYYLCVDAIDCVAATWCGILDNWSKHKYTLSSMKYKVNPLSPTFGS